MSKFRIDFDVHAEDQSPHILAAKSNVPKLSPIRCEVCDDDMPLARLMAVPGVKNCVHCQEFIETRKTVIAP